MKKIKKLVLEWLFGTDDIKDYMELLRDNIHYIERLITAKNDHIKTLKMHKEDLITMRKLIQICENHDINVDEEIKYVELYEVNAIETLD